MKSKLFDLGLYFLSYSSFVSNLIIIKVIAHNERIGDHCSETFKETNVFSHVKGAYSWIYLRPTDSGFVEILESPS